MYTEARVSAPIYKLTEFASNELFIMRDDLLPYSFGGNKVRKALLFFQEIEAGNYDTVVTYGSSSSNHCRIIANMAAAKGRRCHIISTEGASESLNRKMVEIFHADITLCDTTNVAQTIESVMSECSAKGERAYFIQGGGHGNVGTRAYDLAFDEVDAFEHEHNLSFDYIFHASGTGTTQAGLICGKLRCNSPTKIVGISIARQKTRGARIVSDSVKSYCGVDAGDELIFIDDYICGEYGQCNAAIDETIERVFTQFGVPLDPIYTGKAFWGMEQYVKKYQVSQKKILFIHTGGTPIFCDWMRKRI